MADPDEQEKSCDLGDLINRLYQGSPDKFSDVTLVLRDGSEIRSHKLILALVSPKFAAQFYGLWANKNQDKFEVTEVEAETFRSMMSFIYSSGEMESCDESNSDQYWNLLSAAHFYLVEGLIEFCEEELEAFCENIKTPEGYIEFLDNAASFTVVSSLITTGLDWFKLKLPQWMMEGYEFKIETLTESAQAYIRDNEVIMETSMTLLARTMRLQIETFLVKNGTNEQTIERCREEGIANWLYWMEIPDAYDQIRYHFRRQSWQELCKNIFKDALSILNEAFSFTLPARDMSPELSNDVYNFLEGLEVQRLIERSMVLRWYSCPLACPLVRGGLPELENRHCQN